MLKVILYLMKKYIAFFAFMMLFATLGVPQETETLPWRPLCNNTINGPWKESFDGAGNQEFCYVNSTVFYVQAKLSRNFAGQLFKRSSPESYIEGINYVQPQGPFKIGDVTVQFDYYFPFYEDGAECPISSSNFNAVTGFHNVPQYVLVGNNAANFSSSSGDFNDAFMNFTLEGTCGQWQTFVHRVDDLQNDFGSSFSHANRDLGVIGLEVANMYIRNLKVVGNATPETVQVW